MKITNQKKKNKLIRDQLFIVNKSAGRLRLMLIVLLFLIYWTFIAQTEIAPLSISTNFLTLFPEPKSLTSGIIREILLQYFSPSTILFTITPLIIFLSTKKMISRYLHLLFPSTGLNESDRYLTRCAFSFPIRNTFIYEDNLTKPQEIQEHLKFLGGPANFSFDPSSTLIIQNIKNRDYFLIFSDYQSFTEESHLSYGDKISAVISKDDRKVLLKNLEIRDKYNQIINLNLISIRIIFNTSQKESTSNSSRKITMHDARILSYLGGVGRNIIHHFLYAETQNFFYKNSSILLNNDYIPSSIKRVDKKSFDIAPKKLHENYAEIAQAITENSHRVKRKHKHSRYVFLRKKSAFSLNTQDEEYNNEQLILQLSNYLNEQLKSFFHISTIQISIIEIEKYTING